MKCQISRIGVYSGQKIKVIDKQLTDMKGLKASIFYSLAIIIFVGALVSILDNQAFAPAYAQENSPPFIVSRPPLPPGWNEREIVLYFNVTHSSVKGSTATSGADNIPSDSNHTLVALRLFDKTRNENMKYVTYGIQVKEDKYSSSSVLSDLFLSKEGLLVLDIAHDTKASRNIIAAEQELVFQRWATSSSDGHIAIKSPFIEPDKNYYIEVNILGAENNGNTLFEDNVVPKFDFYWDRQNFATERVIPEFSNQIIALVAAISMGIIVKRYMVVRHSCKI
jgi:hypothetical protein